jgi:hypothetical protein
MRMKTSSRVRWVVSMVGALGAAAVWLAGCGGGSGMCGGGACGGNLVGTWNISSICNGSSASSSSGTCTTTVDTSQLREQGTITFNTDQTYTTELTISGSETEIIPTSCLGITCDQENTALMQAAGSGGFYSSISCTTVGTSCSCRFVAAQQTVSTTGTYVTSGGTVTTVTTTSAGTSSGSTDNYCVLGSTLTLSSMSMAGMTGGSSVLLTRR